MCIRDRQALGTACGHMASRTVGAYSYVRKQFGMSIGKFEGVQEALARIGGLTYQPVSYTHLDVYKRQV